MADISPAVRTLISEHISSVAQLELILLLRHTPERWWTADELGQELRTDPAWIRYVLSELCQRGMCEHAPEEGIQYRFKPRSPEIEQTLNDLARDYLINRVHITELIYARPSDSLRAFSDAFDFRKGGRNA